MWRSNADTDNDIAVESCADVGTKGLLQHSGLILGLRPTNERRRYFVTTSLICWAQT